MTVTPVQRPKASEPWKAFTSNVKLAIALAIILPALFSLSFLFITGSPFIVVLIAVFLPLPTYCMNHVLFSPGMTLPSNASDGPQCAVLNEFHRLAQVLQQSQKLADTRMPAVDLGQASSR